MVIIRLHGYLHFSLMLQWICGHTKRDHIRNDDIRERLGWHQSRSLCKCFGHIQWRSLEAPVRSGVISRIGDGKRGRGRPNLT
jgi:hypothetical protein